MSLGRQIQIARVMKGWKQQDLRQATGLSQKHLSLIENDKAEPGANILRQICLALGVSSDFLLELPSRGHEVSHA
jgi:transcriptional regulator with XRE-family HTH domain